MKHKKVERQAQIKRFDFWEKDNQKQKGENK